MSEGDDEWVDKRISGCINECIVEWASRWLDGWEEGGMSSRWNSRRQTLAHSVKENSARVLNGLAWSGSESPSLGRAILEQHKH